MLIYGSRADGHAKVVLEVARLAGPPPFETVGLLDDLSENQTRTVGGLAVLGGREFLGQMGTIADGVLLGFGDAPGRQNLVEELEVASVELPVLLHPTACVSRSARLGVGSQVLAGGYVGPGAAVGAGGLVNTGAIVEHDVTLGAGTVVGPGTVLSGRVSVGSGSEIGAGAVVLPDRTIGERARVGAGAVVTRDVPAGATVVGNPARSI